MTKPSNIFIAFVLLISAVLLAFYAVAALAPQPAATDQQDNGRVYVPLKRPTVSFGNPSIGPRDAAVTIWSFGDYQCEPCTQMNSTLAQIRSEFPDDIRVVWKDMPDDSKHLLATPAANAARCAGDQGKFWEYHAELMKLQGALVEANFPVYAAQLGLDAELYASCLSSGRNIPLVERDVLEGRRLNIEATPTIFVGDRRLTGTIGPDQLRTYVTAAIAEAKQQ